MVLDRLDDNRLALRAALKNERILVAKERLLEIYDTEDALRAHIDRLDESDWESAEQSDERDRRYVDAELSRFPDHVDHVWHRTTCAARPASNPGWTPDQFLARNERDAVSGGAVSCKKLSASRNLAPGKMACRRAPADPRAIVAYARREALSTRRKLKNFSRNRPDTTI